MFTDLAYAMAPAQQGGQQGQGSGLIGLLPIVLIFVVFYFLVLRPQQKRAKDHKTMIDGLKKGDKVVTSGGVYGVVEEVKTNTLIVKIAENVKVKFGKAYVAELRTTEDD